MVSAKSDRMDISGQEFFFFLSFVSLVPPQRVSTATTTTRLSDGYSKVLSCPFLFFFLKDGKIEQIERFAAFFVCLSSMSSMAFPSGSPCYCRVVGWQAAREKPFE